MKAFLILSIVALATAAPQYDRADSSGGTTVNCERQQAGNGQYVFTCQANPGTITEEKTLWVPTSTGNEELLIRVPNYNFREIIRAGLRGGEAGGTNVRVHVARPQVQSTVEGEFKQAGRDEPRVQVVYEQVQNRGETHYGGGGEAYRSLSKQIAEPGARYRKSA